MSFTALAPAPGAALPGARLAPDRLMLWPLDDGLYGLDMTFEGSWSREDAEEAAAFVRARGLCHGLRQSPEAGWMLRLGPLSSLQVAEALDGLLAPTTI